MCSSGSAMLAKAVPSLLPTRTVWLRSQALTPLTPGGRPSLELAARGGQLHGMYVCSSLATVGCCSIQQCPSLACLHVYIHLVVVSMEQSCINKYHSSNSGCLMLLHVTCVSPM